ncbi:hypothetical protein JYK00_07840 [Thermosipho ferrireducens]|uniref:Uncharacterized protein n=1 Tax=Thermosipho ferrireducens TaxID=2571116 RepID=A0ABX7S624_9BACT|nr:hypothetical protein [Thermosipho ferrireducens]QTA37634.1 hypothetical protein JYK00_07840 [Thermosipho ferrireducens]
MNVPKKIAFTIAVIILGVTIAFVTYDFVFNAINFVNTFVIDTQLFAQTLAKYEKLFNELKELRKNLEEEVNLEKLEQINLKNDKISIVTTDKEAAKLLNEILSSKTIYFKKLNLNVQAPFPIIFQPSTVTVNMYLELGGLE